MRKPGQNGEKMADESLEVKAKYTFSIINNSPSLVIRVNHGKELKNALAAILPDYKACVDAIKNATEKRPTTTQSVQSAPPVQPPVQQKIGDVNEGSKCMRCGAERVLNPKTGKWFCKDKCWLRS